MALFARYLKDALQKSGLGEMPSLECVQTACANGASTGFLSKVLGLMVDCADIGVKNLHKMAPDNDVGIYTETNGHETI